MKIFRTVLLLAALILSAGFFQVHADTPNDSTANYWVLQVQEDNIPNQGGENDPGMGESNDSIVTYDFIRPTYPGDINIPLVPFEPWIPAEPAVPIEPPVSVEKLPTVNPDKPGIPEVSNTYSVGSTAGSLNVSSMGAAQYMVPISCPDGGSLTPQVALCYDSQQSSYGIAGYGVSLSGLSCITRGGRNLHDNDGIVGGVTYTSADHLFLDGKRLVLVSGEPCESGAGYCLEGDPYTEITVHGSTSGSSGSVWFEVRTPDGRRYEYGNTTDSRISFQDKGYTRTASWYVSRIADVHDNYVTYHYTVRNFYAYPERICYGMNSSKDRGLLNVVRFDYSNMQVCPGYFNIGGCRGNIDRKLSTITTLCNDSVYRRYHLTYNETSDNSRTKFARLTRIREENGRGESLTPTELTWSYLPSAQLWDSEMDDPTKELSSDVSAQDRCYFAADMNGDGVSDIIRISPVKIRKIFEHGEVGTEERTRVYISKSNVSSSGAISYSSPVYYTLSANIAIDNIRGAIGGTRLIDWDGDGYNDLVIPYFYTAKGDFIGATFFCITGSSVVNNTNERFSFFDPEFAIAPASPSMAESDIDMDGKDELICVEKVEKNGSYTGRIIRAPGNLLRSGATVGHHEFKISLSSRPEKIFCGDYNNDGLTDLIILHESGYKIYFNQGGAVEDDKFIETGTVSGTSVKDCWRLDQGDIDGDGLIDFIFNISKESYLRIARNNGDGTFTLTQSDDLGIVDHDTHKDDARFAMKVFDIDHDGKSDVFISKAGYEYHGGFTSAYGYTDTRVKILLSDGQTLKLKTSIVKNREADADEKTIFTGDFNGDGYIELANYGGCLTSEGGSFTADRLKMYRTLSATSNSGRIEKIKDGMGNETQIFHGYATASGIYSRTPIYDYTRVTDIRSYSLPLPLVWKVNYPGNASRPGTVTYGYKDFKVHMKGGGTIGFEEISNTHLLTGETTVTAVKKWDTERLIPLETKVTNSIAGKSSVTETKYTVEEVDNTYFAYESTTTVTDMYGNTAVTESHYDSAKGVLLDRTVRNDGDDMYKKVTYSGYVRKSGVWLPAVMTLTQKHGHDSDSYSNRIQYLYDDKGNVLQSIERYGTPMTLTTVSTYDEYGNCLSSVRRGAGVVPITGYNDYDPTGRYVVKTYQSPAGAVNTFRYDGWGNLLEESDMTVTSNPLTSTHSYDGWGRRVSTTAPDGTVSSVTVGWGNTYGQHHYAFHQTTGKPWKLVWYNRSGLETQTKTFGPKNVLISKATSYDGNGNPVRIETTNGWFNQKEYISYDGLGRMVTDSISSGKVTSRTYGNRTVSTTSDGKTSTAVSDAWGNLLSSTNPAGGKVTYTYKSHGNPVKVTANGATVEMDYDAAGNKIYMKDPDAGETTYSYSADGHILKQTDAKGIVTTYAYDNLGRVSATRIGSETFMNSYITSGTGKLRLKRKSSVGGYVDYTYDRLGRVITEVRSINGESSYTFNYSYDEANRLKSVKYPGQTLTVDYTYDTYGFRTGITANGKKVYGLKDYTGTTVTSTFMDSVTYTRKIDSNGFEQSREIKFRNKTLDRMETEFDPLTANLMSRTRTGFSKETFRYDNLDRLTEVLIGNVVETGMTYASNGNITSKTGLGAYSYNSSNLPHAVMGVENSGSVIPSETLLTGFNDFGMINSIESVEDNLDMEFTYGPDRYRSKSVLKEAGKEKRKTVYVNNLEMVHDNGMPRHFYFLDEDIIFINSPEGQNFYLAFKDHLGSILSVVDNKGKKVFDASYDAWGKQEVRTNTIALQRGYCGHEILNEFGIINMNGRLYDPVLGRFLSPDPFVQLPGDPQNYNRYSYCLNNPLKYTDPSGHFIGLPAVLMGVFNIGQSMMMAHMNGQNIWKAAGIHLLSSLASFGVGQLMQQVTNMAPIGKELLRAGMHGVSSGLMSMLGGGNFLTGAVSGMSASAIGSLNVYAKLPDWGMGLASAAVGGVTSLVIGSDFVSGAMQGLRIAYFNHLAHTEMEYTDFEKLPDGTQIVALKEFEYVYNPSTGIGNGVYSNQTLESWSYWLGLFNTGTTTVNIFGIAMEQYGRPTLVDFSMVPNSLNPSVMGSYTYKRIVPFDKIGGNIVKVAKPASTVIGIAQAGVGAAQDILELQATGKTNLYNTVKVCSQLVVSAYAWEIGFSLGGFVGSLTGFPIVAGGAAFVGGAALSYGSWEVTGAFVDYLYGK